MKNSGTLNNAAICKSTGVFLFLWVVMHFSAAQTPAYYNYNTAGSSNSFPFNIPAGKEVQLLYLPGDFNQPSPAPAGTITGIYFRISDSYPLEPWTYTNLTIKMGQADITTFEAGSFYTGTLDTVFYRASVTLSGTTGQWMILALDTPFVYDPSRSLIIDVGQCSVPGATGYSMTFTNLTNFRRNWSLGGCPFVFSGQNSTIYHLGLDICAQPPAPVNITLPESLTICSGNLTTLSASGLGTLGWYSEATGGIYLGGGTSYNTPALTQDTTYYVQDSICNLSSARTAITVTVNPSYAFTEIHSICEGDNCHWQGTDYTASDTVIAGYTGVNGCDSIYTLYLTVNPVYSNTEDHSICEGETYSWQGAAFTTAGTYIATYTGISGCDSTYTLNLTVNPAYLFTEDISICEGDTCHWQGADYTASDTVIAGYTGVNGCDSIYALYLTVNPVYSNTAEHSICEGEIYSWQGAAFTTAGTYTANYTGIHGCDSIYTLHLTVNTVDVAVTADDSVITANEGGAVYQWLDCGNAYAPIDGATLQSFTAAGSGQYAVIVTKGSCSDTSACIPIVRLGIASFSTDGIAIYPNPVSDEMIIEIKGNNEKTDFVILNSSGEIVYHGNFIQKTSVNTSKFNSGIYLVKINNGKSFVYKKIIKD